MSKHNVGLALAASIAWTSFAPPAHAGDQLAEIRALPFVKADAYREAINEYCFPVTDYTSFELTSAAWKQAAYFEQGLDRRERIRARALTHLAGDQNACEPAIAFLERTISELPEGKEKLDALVKDYRIEQAGLEAIAEGEALHKAAEAERPKIERHARLCREYADLSDTSDPNTQELQGLLFNLNVKENFLAGCGNVFETQALAATIAEIKAKKAEIAEKIEGEKAQAAEAFAKANPPVDCRFEGLPKITITTADRQHWIAVGEAKPVRLFVGNGLSSATTADGIYLVIRKGGIQYEGKEYSGSCKSR